MKVIAKYSALPMIDGYKKRERGEVEFTIHQQPTESEVLEQMRIVLRASNPILRSAVIEMEDYRQIKTKEAA